MELREGSQIVFGLFKADLANGKLSKNGYPVPLQEQPFRVLALLLERAGTLVSREELQKSLWPTDTFVEFDQGLNTAIKKLRQALGDSADNPRFIETLPRKGYMFIAPVTGADAAPAPVPSAHRPTSYWPLAALAVGLAVAAAWSWSVWPRPAPPASSPTPLTSYPGVEDQPSFSPDGRSVAFTWNGAGEDNFDIYVKQIGGEKLVRLTSDPARDFGPAWSPDGRLIAFCRVLDANRTVVLLTPAAGGPEVKVTEIATPRHYQSPPFLAWSLNGEWLVITDVAAGAAEKPPAGSAGIVEYKRRRLFLVSTQTGERRALTTDESPSLIDGGPAFSPDGRTLAFYRMTAEGVGELYLLSLSPRLLPEGSPKRLDTRNRLSLSPAWTRDGRSVLFAAGSEDDLRLWSIPVGRAGVASPLQFVGDHTACPAVSAQGKLAYAQRALDSNIWRIELAAPGVAAGAARRFLASTREELNPQFSPDGKRVVFGSNRGGFREIWIANADGTDPMPLTSLGASITGGPNWSPDSSRIVFDSNKEGQWEVYVVSAAGGIPRRLTDNPAVDGVPSWSRDGAWIYFVSWRSGDPQVWKMPASGGPAVQVTKKGGYFALESADGQFVYYSKRARSPGGLWRVSPAGGEEIEVLPSVTYMNFACTNNGIYYIPQAQDGHYAIHFLNLATRTDSVVATLSGRATTGLAVSPDEKTLLYSQIDHDGSDLMLVENFR